jgi:hypothetical protein
VDSSAQNCFVNCAQDIGIDTDASHKALERYIVEVVRLIQSHHPDHTAAAKFKWIMSRPSEHHFPMMTAFVVDALISSWADLGDAINDVSVHLEPPNLGVAHIISSISHNLYVGVLEPCTDGLSIL